MAQAAAPVRFKEDWLVGEIIYTLYILAVIIVGKPGELVVRAIDSMTGKTNLQDSDAFVYVVGVGLWLSLIAWLSKHITITWT